MMSEQIKQNLRDAAADWAETDHSVASAVLAVMDDEPILRRLATEWLDDDEMVAYGFTILDILDEH